MFDMLRSGLVALVALILAGAGLALLLWLFRWLWNQGEGEAAEPVIELKASVPALEAEAGLPEEKEELPIEEEPPAVVEEPPAEPEEEALETEEPPKPAETDDLKKIEGIGPKIAGVLQDAGIITFADLADVDVGRLKQILEDADPRLLRLADPASWPDQASLAAAGNWDALDALKGELKGGRK